MRIMVLGGDGFCGWPTALRLAAKHNVRIVDNYSRRRIDEQLGTRSLTEIAQGRLRLSTASKLGYRLSYHYADTNQYQGILSEIKTFEPEAIIHFAEQRAAPYSMVDAEHRNYTVNNNITGTHNVLSAIAEHNPKIHLVHLGTMGVYGYSKDFGVIPEGYLNVKVNSTEKDVDILYPTNPGSVYHMTKSLDQLLFQFYNKNWGLSITDLHQGIVWGTQTSHTTRHEDLVNRFDYDGMYGTVLNRFIVEAALGHPITVYGTGGQSRAFIHIEDTTRCVEIAVENPPTDTTKVRIFNQVSEVRSVLELAEMCEELGDSKIQFVENPRKELAENELEVENAGLRSLGFEPITLNDSLVDDIKFIASESADNFNPEKVLTSPKW